MKYLDRTLELYEQAVAEVRSEVTIPDQGYWDAEEATMFIERILDRLEQQLTDLNQRAP